MPNEVMYGLFLVWYEGDSYLISDCLVATSRSVSALKALAKQEHEECELIDIGEPVLDTGGYGSPNRLRLVKLVYLNGCWRIPTDQLKV